MDKTLARLESLGYLLPNVPTPVASYVNCVRTGNLLFLSGGLPIDGDDKILGKVPSEISTIEATDGARLAVLNRLSVIKKEIGSLDKVVRIVSLTGLVNSEPDYHGHPHVINGASDLLLDVFEERGRHSRTAFGAAALPLNACVEVNMVVEVEPE